MEDILGDVKNLSLESGQYYEEECSLCDQIFFGTEAGRRLLQLWEHKYFYAPVAPYNQPPAYANYREGENNFLRSIRIRAKNNRKDPTKTTEIKREVPHG